jgi:hypothetical protein
MFKLAILTALIAGAAAPALAQPYLGLGQLRDAQAAADLQALRNRDIAITNELSRMDARVQADQAMANLRAGGATPTVPTVTLGPNAKPPVVDASKLASIPDAALAQSNAAVRAAAGNRR